eukprot:TRINITY_DN5889_c2_g4_i1.p1 TRINITY_DN5889_c2_g4~~TRINITY_DN5889_c2_g4_i1.p1  ORF type:complete len:381 (-),score=70.24 TRINITY_DN5889_c2_g4_i1:65-1207(-)
MSQVRRDEDEGPEAASLSGFWRSTLVQLEVYRDRPAPACAFVLCLAYWACALWRTLDPSVLDPHNAGACLLPDVVFLPRTSEWRRYALHALWPLEPGYLRGILMSIALLLLGYGFEYEVGTPHFAALLLGSHAVLAAALLHLRIFTCYVSVEPVIVALAVVMHRVNPKVYTNGLDVSLRVPWAVEPRWHLWIVQTLLLLFAGDFPTVLVAHAVALIVGSLCAVRDPELLFDAVAALRRGSPKVGYVIHIALLLFAILFMPLTAQDLPWGLPGALLDGRVLNLAWWKMAMPASPSMVQMGLVGLVAGEAMWICKLLILGSIPLLLSPFRMWLRAYSILCVMLAMYAMNSGVWRFPHIGFVTLLYLVWAFWKLPNAEAWKRD